MDRAAPRARLIWRSGGFNTDFLDDVRVTVAGTSRGTREILEYDRDLAARLHLLDRVHTYGSFHIAELVS